MSGTYVSVTPTNSSAALIANRFHWLNPSKATRQSSYHVTLIYSAGQEILDAARLARPHVVYSAFLSRIDWFLGHDKVGYLVGLVESQELQSRHSFWTLVGGEHSYRSYTPHITLATGISESEWKAIQRSVNNIQLDLPILLTGEKAEPINESWTG